MLGVRSRGKIGDAKRSKELYRNRGSPLTIITIDGPDEPSDEQAQDEQIEAHSNLRPNIFRTLSCAILLLCVRHRFVELLQNIHTTCVYSTSSE